MSATYTVVRHVQGELPPSNYAPSEIIVSTPSTPGRSRASSHASSTVSRGRSGHHAVSDASYQPPVAVPDMPTAGFFNLRKAEKDRRGMYPIGRIGSSTRSGSSPGMSYTSSAARQRRRSFDEVDYDDTSSLTPDDSISQVSFSGRSYRSHRSYLPRLPAPSNYSSRSGGQMQQYRTVARRPAHLDPYPEEHEDEWRAQTGFSEHEVPYYDAEHDFDGNYMVGVVPNQVLRRPETWRGSIRQKTGSALRSERDSPAPSQRSRPPDDRRREPLAAQDYLPGPVEPYVNPLQSWRQEREACADFHLAPDYQKIEEPGGYDDDEDGDVRLEDDEEDEGFDAGRRQVSPSRDHRRNRSPSAAGDRTGRDSGYSSQPPSQHHAQARFSEKPTSSSRVRYAASSRAPSATSDTAHSVADADARYGPSQGERTPTERPSGGISAADLPRRQKSFDPIEGRTGTAGAQRRTAASTWSRRDTSTATSLSQR